jgi:hypothetical protein
MWVFSSRSVSTVVFNPELFARKQSRVPYHRSPLGEPPRSSTPDFAADVLFREAQAAIDELAKQGEIVGTASGYRAK